MNLNQYQGRFQKLYKKNLIKRFEEIEKIPIQSKKIRFKFPLDFKKFFYSKSVVDLEYEDEKLKGTVSDHDFKSVYLSYDTLNNNFNLAPEHSLLDLKENINYQFYIGIEVEKNLSVIPYIVHYNNGQKTKLTSIDTYGQSINFSDDDQCRLTFKLIGSGEFEINGISIVSEG